MNVSLSVVFSNWLIETLLVHGLRTPTDSSAVTDKVLSVIPSGLTVR